MSECLVCGKFLCQLDYVLSIYFSWSSGQNGMNLVKLTVCGMLNDGKFL